MNAFTLLLGGELVRTPSVDAQTAGTRVIAADAGIRHAAPLGLAPELWVGDFNSVPAELRDAFPEVRAQVFPADKDRTDGEIAIDAALALGARILVMAGAFGGPRADHAFLHLAAAVRLAEAGIDVVLTSGPQEGVPLPSGTNRVRLCARHAVLDHRLFRTLRARLAGAKWPLTAIDLPFGSSLTISNAVSGRLSRARPVAGRCCSLTPMPSRKLPMAPPLLNLDDIRLTFGGAPLLDGAALSVSAGDRIALVGRNGSGKSTLLKIAAGLVEPQDGSVFRQPSATVRYLPQEPDLDGFADVARLCRSRAWPGRRSATAPPICSSISA